MPKAPARRPPKSTVRLPRVEREQQLLDAAITCFIAQGYQGTAVEDIAVAAGVTRPVIYNLFGSKDGIYLACLARARAELDRELMAAATQATAQSRLRAGIEGYFRFVERNRESWQLLFAGGIAVAGPAAEEAQRLRFATVDRIVALLGVDLGGLPRRRLQAYAHALSGAGEQLAKWWMSQPRIRREELVENLMRLAWDGLQVELASRPSPPPAVGRSRPSR